ncbi:MAG TPA: LptF/LptG family permease [Gemmatimonadales bacterium]|nr:LptF/LptG family permease [Gemmatimonadales bacterium]
MTRWAVAASQGTRIAQARDAMDRYNVEINKKWSISLACLPFVLIGVVLALRFPRGGMGLVIGGSLAVFSLYYVGLTAGESLADRGVVGPAVAMWSANAILLVLGLIGLVRVNRESGSTRGGDLQEMAEWLRSLARRSRVWRRARP